MAFSSVFSLQFGLFVCRSKFNSIRCAEAKISLILHSLFVWGQRLWWNCPKFESGCAQTTPGFIGYFHQCFFNAFYSHIAAFGLFCDLLLVAELFIQWSRWNSIMWKRTTLAWCAAGNTPHDMLLPDATIPDNFPTSQTVNFEFFSSWFTFFFMWTFDQTYPMGLCSLYPLNQ